MEWLSDIATDLDFIVEAVARIGRAAFVAAYGGSLKSWRTLGPAENMKPVLSKEVLLLDTNIWRYITDAQADARVRRASISTKVAVAVAPAAVYEAHRTA